ncbi:MAG: phosphoribosyl transferase [Candidatus Levybacteria bacterium]|nr:phosphoribosyl transferase [Candidatus Levybacteria bacterium]
MHFLDRSDAGKKLARALFAKYKEKDVVVFGLPRGGVITAFEVSKKLKAPLNIVITRKIGHLRQPEYALAAVSENGHLVGKEEEVKLIDKVWFEKEVKKEQKEAKRRKKLYLSGRKSAKVAGKIVIIVDDGIATGLTIKAAIREIQHHNPKFVVVAAPVAPLDTVYELQKEADDVVILHKASNFYAIGQYYDSFEQVSDEEVIHILEKAGRG